jgi:uncharacterized protein YlxP (DUF503 family)
MPDIEIVQGFPFEFYGATHTAYLASDRQFYLRLDHTCEALDIDPNSQRRRIQNDDAISDKLVLIPFETPYQDSVRVRQVACLNLRALPYWLGTLDASRVKEELRPRIKLYKRDFAETAWFVYRADILPAEIISEMDAYVTPQERELAELMAEFRSLKRKVDVLTGRLDEELSRFGVAVGELGGRVELIQARVIGEATVNSEQAWLLSELIKLVGAALYESQRSRTHISKSQAFARAQLEFKEHFRVHIYSALPQRRMEEALEFLAGRWRFYQPGQPLPELFSGGHQPSLF